MKQEIRLGMGVIKQRNGKKEVKGAIPYEENTEVYIIDTKTFETLCRNSLDLLIQNGESLEPEITTVFPDYIEWTDNGETTKLNLNRSVYTTDPTNQIFIRYTSIEQDLKELPYFEKPKSDNVEDQTVIRDKINKGEYTPSFPEVKDSGIYEIEGNEWYYDGENWFIIEEEEDE